MLHLAVCNNHTATALEIHSHNPQLADEKDSIKYAQCPISLKEVHDNDSAFLRHYTGCFYTPEMQAVILALHAFPRTNNHITKKEIIYGCMVPNYTLLHYAILNNNLELLKALGRKKKLFPNLLLFALYTDKRMQ